jgi:hypothetical protein
VTGVGRWAARPAWADRLVAEVDRSLPAGVLEAASWPDPHEDRPPDESEYSVSTNPAKYRVLDLRLDAWAGALDRLGLATTASPAERPEWIDAPRPATQVDRLWVFRPLVADGLTVWFARSLVDGGPFGFDVGVGSDALGVVQLECVPDCGCDACDRGSRAELAAIDEAVLTVARGGVVHARTGSRRMTAGIETWHSIDGAPEAWLDSDTDPPPGVRRWVGAPWLT